MNNKINDIDNTIRHDWDIEESVSLISRPILELLHEAQTLHRMYFNKNEIQMSKLLSIKTGSCPEDCAYCPQSAHYNVNLKKEPLISIEEVKVYKPDSRVYDLPVNKYQIQKNEIIFLSANT